MLGSLHIKTASFMHDSEVIEYYSFQESNTTKKNLFPIPISSGEIC